MDPDFNDPIPDGAGIVANATDGSVDEGVVQSLVENLGMFTADQVRAALKETGGASDRAADWLFSHMDDIDAAIAALNGSNAGTDEKTVAETKVELEDSDRGLYVLQGIVSHIGKNTGSGHYVAHLKDQSGRWVIYNDEKVAVSSKPPLEHAYLYLYRRSDTIGAPLNNF
jgi:ubiquitin carboxyl-terminal hydrolase 5/13